jgi:hypothetical protein
MGIGGAIFDWLRMLYERMEYYVRHGDQNSAEFKAFIGLLTGDPASPVLWNLFMADLVLLDDHDDLFFPTFELRFWRRQMSFCSSPYRPRAYNAA